MAGMLPIKYFFSMYKGYLYVYVGVEYTCIARGGQGSTLVPQESSTLLDMELAH